MALCLSLLLLCLNLSQLFCLNSIFLFLDSNTFELLQIKTNSTVSRLVVPSICQLAISRRSFRTRNLMPVIRMPPFRREIVEFVRQIEFACFCISDDESWHSSQAFDERNTIKTWEMCSASNDHFYTRSIRFKLRMMVRSEFDTFCLKWITQMAPFASDWLSIVQMHNARSYDHKCRTLRKADAIDWKNELFICTHSLWTISTIQNCKPIVCTSPLVLNDKRFESVAPSTNVRF